MKKSLNNNFERSLAWRDAGVSAFPLAFKAKRPLVKWSQYRDRLPKPIELKRFFTTQEVNLALVCGGERGLTVVDFDIDTGYDNFIEKAPSGIKHIFENTYRVKTCKGVHVYLWCPEMPSLKDTERKIDVKAVGGYVVAPISVHPSGEPYSDIGDFDIGKIKTVPKKAILNLFPRQDERRVDWDSVSNGCYNPDNGTPFPSANADLDEIRQRFPILNLAVKHTHMFPERFGSSIFRGRCPLPTHDDKDPSFWVDTRTGLCGCFGNCELNGKSTDVIGLYAKIYGISYGNAVKALRDLL